MNYSAFTNDSLLMMTRASEGHSRLTTRFASKVRNAGFTFGKPPEWKMHAADLEFEMLKRGMIFDVIDWSEVLVRSSSATQ